MTNLRVKWAFLLVVLLVFGYYLLPTLRLYSMDSATRNDDRVAGIRDNAMRLGLDLQGGSYLVYEVDLDKLGENRRGDEVDRAIEIIRNRIDLFGVTEPVIQKQGDNRIVVQLPGLQDPARAKDIVGKTARLDFLMVKTQQELLQAMSRVDQTIARRAALGKSQGTSGGSDTADPEFNPLDLLPDSADSDTASVDTTAAGDTSQTATTPTDLLLTTDNPFSSLFQQVPGDAGIAYCPEENRQRANEMLKSVAGDPAKQKVAVLAGGTILLWGDRVFGAGTENPGRYLYALTARADLTGDNVADAQVAFGLEPSRPNAAGVSLTLDKRGAVKFTRITGNNVGRQLAIVLDQTVKSAPTIIDKIRGGRASITGLSDDEEARDLSIVFRAGALPTDVVLLEERTVGPTLGADSVEQGVKASLLGLGLVVLLMSTYYRASGMLAVVALFLNLFFLFSVLGMLRGTLTLPGIAGIVLTIGMAVDANVLVLERIREEIRTGKNVRGSIDAGYSRALVTILDSNITTLISAVVLFQFGTGPIKGFATTLMIGIVANIFTAVFVTRLVYDSILAKRTIRKLNI